MAELRAAETSLGHADVMTYILSGNVLVTPDRTDRTPDRARIGERKQARSGAPLRARRSPAHTGARGHSRRASSARCERSGAGTMKADPRSAEGARSTRARAGRDWLAGPPARRWHQQAEPQSHRASTMPSRTGAAEDRAPIWCAPGTALPAWAGQMQIRRFCVR